MRIRLLFVETPHDQVLPWLVEASDEYTEEEHNGVPEWVIKGRADAEAAGQQWREAFVTVDDEAVAGLFGTPTLTATFHIGQSPEEAR